MSQAHCRSRAFSLAKLAYRPAGWPEGYAVYAPLFLVLKAAGRQARGCCDRSAGGQFSSIGAPASPHTRVRLGVGIGACTL